MRLFLKGLFACFLIISSFSVKAQNMVVSGKVLSSDNTPVIGASVVVKGKKSGTRTDTNGAFSLNVNKGDQLLITSVGFSPQTVKVTKTGEMGVINLETLTGTLGAVVVTAMDIKRNPRELGFSVQPVSGKDIIESKRDNFVNALQGRVAGLTVTPTNGAAGASSNIVLRGFNSLALSNQPLFIIDGVIVDNSIQTENSANGGGSGIGLASERDNRQNDYTNRIGDLNPNDIESVTVLKGPEATALYGSQASSGAIVITTKRLSQTAKKLGVYYDNSFRIQKLTRIPKVQNVYSAGTNGIADNVFTFFGPKYPGNLNMYDNIHEFFQTGFSNTHSLSTEWGNDIMALRFSGSYLNEKGVVPENNYDKLNLRVSSFIKPNKYIDLSPSISLVSSNNEKTLRGAGGYLLNLLQWPNEHDINATSNLGSDGKKVTIYPQSDPTNEVDNPLFNVRYNRSHDDNKRLIATFGVNVYPTSWLTVSGRFGYDTYKNNGWTFYHPQSFYTTAAQGGTIDNYYKTYKGYNHTINATAVKKFGKFGTRVMVGNMWQDYRTDISSITGNKIKDVTRHDSDNTDPATRARLSRQTLYGQPNYQIYRQMAFFGEVGLSYNNFLFLDYTHRFEQASTLPQVNRKFNYPGASLSFIFTDVIPGLKNNNFIDFGKLRGSIAKTARSNSPYSNQSVFNIANSSGGGFTYGFTNNNFLLEPEKQSTFEIGTELRFLKGLVTLDAAYYNTLNSDQIIELFRASYGTGFILNTINLGKTRNKGVEVILGINPVRSQNVNWSINLNYARMRNQVISLPANVSEFYLSDTWFINNTRGGLVQGGPTTSITSFGFLRNTAGQILVSPTTGLPLNDNKFSVHGDRNPKYTLGINNSLRYKNWRLSMLWNLKVGGDIVNGTERFLTTTGKSLRTLDREKPVIVDGVLKDGLENSATPTKNTIQILPVYNQAFYTTVPDEFFIEHNVNWLRMSDLTISYSFPKSNLKRLPFFKTLSVFATGNDLILLTNYSGPDPQVNGTTPATRGVGAFGFDYGNIATPVSFNFGLRTSF